MIVPITLVILSIVGIIIGVAFKTDSSMKNLMREDTEFLLANVVARIENNNESLESIEMIVDNTILESLETIQNRETKDIDNSEIIELAQLLHVDELNLFSPDAEVLYSNISENIGRTFEVDHPTPIFLSYIVVNLN